MFTLRLRWPLQIHLIIVVTTKKKQMRIWSIDSFAFIQFVPRVIQIVGNLSTNGANAIYRRVEYFFGQQTTATV